MDPLHREPAAPTHALLVLALGGGNAAFCLTPLSTSASQLVVEQEEARLYLDCGEAERSRFHRRPGPLTFSHKSGIFVANAGGTGLDKFVVGEASPHAASKVRSRGTGLSCQKGEGQEERMGGREERMGGREERMGGREERMGGREEVYVALDQRLQAGNPKAAAAETWSSERVQRNSGLFELVQKKRLISTTRVLMDM